MATTSTAVVDLLFDSMRELGVDFALLHEAGTLAGGAHPPGDVDLVVGSDPMAILGAVARIASREDLHLVGVWPYDVCGVNTFWLNGSATDGAQLDFLYDPDGRGKYGVCTDRLLARACRAERLPRVDTRDEHVYLLRKRQVKGDAAQFARLARGIFTGTLEHAAAHVLAPWARTHLEDALRTGRLHHGRLQTVSSRRHLARRIASPVGHWVHLEHVGDDGAELRARLASVLVHTAVTRRPAHGAREPAWWARRVAPVRWRAGVVLSTGHVCRALPADVTVDGLGLATDDLARRVIDGVARRVLVGLAGRTAEG